MSGNCLVAPCARLALTVVWPAPLTLVVSSHEIQTLDVQGESMYWIAGGLSYRKCPEQKC